MINHLNPCLGAAMSGWNKCRFPGRSRSCRTVVDWLDACRSRRIHALLDLYDEAATLECACEGQQSLTGRAALEAYWRPRLAAPSPGSFAMDDVAADADGVDAGLPELRGQAGAYPFPLQSDRQDSAHPMPPAGPLRRVTRAVAAVARRTAGPSFDPIRTDPAFASRTMKRSPLHSSISWLSIKRRACSMASASSEQDSPTNLTKCPSPRRNTLDSRPPTGPATISPGHQTPFGNKWQWPRVVLSWANQRRGQCRSCCYGASLP